MVHYSCDLCGRPVSDQHFIVKLEVSPAPGNDALTAADLDNDHLQEMSGLLDEIDLDEAEEADPFSTHSKQFDLCAECRRQFIRDPLGRTFRRRFRFSGN